METTNSFTARFSRKENGMRKTLTYTERDIFLFLLFLKIEAMDSDSQCNTEQENLGFFILEMTVFVPRIK